MNFYQQDFPFEEVERFNTFAGARGAGYKLNQIWSVTVCDDDEDDRVTWWTFGPPHHYTNLMHYVVTKENHDNETYYEEKVELDD